MLDYFFKEESLQEVTVVVRNSLFAFVSHNPLNLTTREMASAHLDFSCLSLCAPCSCVTSLRTSPS